MSLKKKDQIHWIYKVLELLTIKAGLLKTMLTVFKHNAKAVTFFKEVKLYATKMKKTKINTNIDLQIQI